MHGGESCSVTPALPTAIEQTVWQPESGAEENTMPKRSSAQEKGQRKRSKKGAREVCDYVKVEL
jgi:hypothetical protein